MTGHSQPLARSPGTHSAMEQRPGWFVPLLVGALVVGALLVFGFVSPATALYAGLFGGMMLVCMGGHGGHASHRAGDRDDPGTGTRAMQPDDLSRLSGRAHPMLSQRTQTRATARRTSERDAYERDATDDQHGSHRGC